MDIKKGNWPTHPILKSNLVNTFSSVAVYLLINELPIGTGSLRAATRAR